MSDELTRVIRYWRQDPHHAGGYTLKLRGHADGPDFRVAPTDTSPARVAVFKVIPGKRDVTLTSRCKTLLEARTFVLRWLQARDIWAYYHIKASLVVEIYNRPLPPFQPGNKFNNHLPR